MSGCIGKRQTSPGLWPRSSWPGGGRTVVTLFAFFGPGLRARRRGAVAGVRLAHGVHVEAVPLGLREHDHRL
ncbi:hypothetical protein ILP97_31760 [Amycolatopsis sp. H6(2020)]|nr:hypothetical protein [Amycolatopsis sp. H6(2020)]